MMIDCRASNNFLSKDFVGKMWADICRHSQVYGRGGGWKEIEISREMLRFGVGDSRLEDSSRILHL